jgi:S-(hydroxymethyl)mycothiol dehydrogenase
MQDIFNVGGKLAVSWYGDCIPARDFPILADWYRQGLLNLEKVVSRTIKLEDTEEAFNAMKRGEVLRSVIVFDN